MANLKRSNTISFTNGSYISPGNGYFVSAYAAGAIANGTSSTPGGVNTTIPVFDGSAFQAGEYLIKNLSIASIYRIVSVDNTVGAANIVVAGLSVTAIATDVFFNLGVDGNGGNSPPAYTQVTPNSPIYSSPDTSVAIDNSLVTCDSNGEYSYYYPAGNTIWELVRNTAGTILGYFVNNSPVTLTVDSGTTTTVDNSIARWSGTAANQIQAGYSSTPITPTITDGGVITAAAVGHTLGGLIVTAGATIGTTLTVAGNTTLGDNVADTTAITGVATVGSTLTVTGATTLAATNVTTLGASGNTTLVDVVTRRLKPSVGTAMVNSDFGTTFSGIAGGWGSTSSVSVAANSTTQRWTATITSGGGSKSANPTFTLGNTIFPDGTFTTVPFCIVQQTGGTTGGSPSTHAHLELAPTATQLVVKWLSTAPADGTYIFTGIILG